MLIVKTILTLVALVLSLGIPSPLLPSPSEKGEIRGKVVLELRNIKLENLGPIVAYLDGPNGPLAFDVPKTTAKIHQKDAKFLPDFLLITAGQTVEMPNDDDIFHNVFSYSPENTFDLGLYPQGVSKSVALKSPGVVKIYCSIHESMNGTVFVAPSPFAVRVRKSGSFSIPEVPPGRYELRVWCGKLPETKQIIEVTPGWVGVTVRLGAATPGPQKTGSQSSGSIRGTTTVAQARLECCPALKSQ